MFNGISYFQILSWLTQITHEAWSTFMEAQLQEFVPLSDQHMCRPRLAQEEEGQHAPPRVAFCWDASRVSDLPGGAAKHVLKQRPFPASFSKTLALGERQG